MRIKKKYIVISLAFLSLAMLLFVGFLFFQNQDLVAQFQNLAQTMDARLQKMNETMENRLQSMIETTEKRHESMIEKMRDYHPIDCENGDLDWDDQWEWLRKDLESK